jgi:hypothetical protein
MGIRTFGHAGERAAGIDPRGVLAACLAALSPYATRDLDRFGKNTLNLADPPETADYETPVVSPARCARGKRTDRPGYLIWRFATMLHAMKAITSSRFDMARLS